MSPDDTTPLGGASADDWINFTSEQAAAPEPPRLQNDPGEPPGKCPKCRRKNDWRATQVTSFGTVWHCLCGFRITPTKPIATPEETAQLLDLARPSKFL